MLKPLPIYVRSSSHYKQTKNDLVELAHYIQTAKQVLHDNAISNKYTNLYNLSIEVYGLITTQYSKLATIKSYETLVHNKLKLVTDGLLHMVTNKAFIEPHSSFNAASLMYNEIVDYINTILENVLYKVCTKHCVNLLPIEHYSSTEVFTITRTSTEVYIVVLYWLDKDYSLSMTSNYVKERDLRTLEKYKKYCMTFYPEIYL